VTRENPRRRPIFYLTAPARCPYLPERSERKVFTHLPAQGAGELMEVLTVSGFRRSQNVAYRPACEGCQACISVRVPVAQFAPSARWRRVLRQNTDLERAACHADPTAEQWGLLSSYLRTRHAEGGMDTMDEDDYAAMLGDSVQRPVVFEYRLKTPDGSPGRLVACALVDALQSGLSLIYSFFEPDEARRSLGSYMILDQIALARELELPHVYLGYWVRGSDKMDYKAAFTPLESLTPEGWRPFVPQA